MTLSAQLNFRFAVVLYSPNFPRDSQVEWCAGSQGLYLQTLTQETSQGLYLRALKWEVPYLKALN